MARIGRTLCAVPSTSSSSQHLRDLHCPRLGRLVLRGSHLPVIGAILYTVPSACHRPVIGRSPQCVARTVQLSDGPSVRGSHRPVIGRSLSAWFSPSSYWTVLQCVARTVQLLDGPLCMIKMHLSSPQTTATVSIFNGTDLY